VNVSEYLRDASRAWPDDVAMVHGSRRLTWAQLDAAVDAVARGLGARGLVAGQRVALAMTNRPELVTAYLAVLRVGMVAVPLPPRADAGELREALTDSAASLVLADETALKAVRDARSRDRQLERDCALVVVGARARRGETGWDALHVPDGPAPVAPRDPETLAVLLYTAGSTGRPRAAMLPHRALVANVEQVGAVEPALMTHDDVCLVVLPLFHVYALNAVLGQALRQGTCCVLVDSFEPERTLADVREHAVTLLPVAPPVVAAWVGRPGLREALASVRTVLCGAAVLDPEVGDEFARESGHRVELGYGLTEAGPVLTTTLGGAADDAPGPGVVGPAVPGVELRVLDVTGNDAGPDDPGEIRVRGDNLFTGYWPDGSGGPDADGWFRTGDVGMLDVDGRLTVLDRMREVVMVSGFSVYPVEVEVVAAEVPGVAQVAVVGVPDARTTEAVVAFVVPDAGADRRTLADRVATHCAENLARFKHPERVVVVDDLPQGPDGTVLKGRLRALARREVLGLETP
jgi:long-chain acyl-CoA synthetase